MAATGINSGDEGIPCASDALPSCSGTGEFISVIETSAASPMATSVEITTTAFDRLCSPGGPYPPMRGLLVLRTFAWTFSPQSTAR
jgi:hypothetical protein